MCFIREENASRYFHNRARALRIQVQLPNIVATILSSKCRVKIVFVLNQHSVQTLSSSGVGHVHI